MAGARALLDIAVAERYRRYGGDANARWGYMSRSGFSDKSHLMRQIEKHADVYTSRVRLSSRTHARCPPAAAAAAAAAAASATPPQRASGAMRSAGLGMQPARVRAAHPYMCYGR